MNNLIHFRDFKKLDPILRKGDLVRLYKMHEYFDELDDEDKLGLAEELEIEDLEGAAGIVTSIELSLPLSHPIAPGQAMYVNIAIPLEDHWEEINGISIYHLHRVLGPDTNELRKCDG